MADPLNILHTIELETLYPIVRCELTLKEPINVQKLERAVELVGQVVPEIFAKYRIQDNVFVPLDRDPKTIVSKVNSYSEDLVTQFDLLRGPQVKMIVVANKLIVYLSHILTDGAGSKQFLYLLADCYNQQRMAGGLTNHQGIDEIKQLIDQTPQQVSSKADHPAKPLYLPALADRQSAKYEVIRTQLNAKQFAELHNVTQNIGVTLNDFFMAAFGKTVQQYCGVPTIALACPTDMRQFLTVEAKQQLRIQNLTARYNFAVESEVTESVMQAAQKVHEQMTTNKQRKQFLQSVRTLVTEVGKGTAIDKLQEIVEQNYHVRPIAYTNFGVIDDKQLRFTDNSIESCLMTGSFRRLPMYQVAISTFAGRLTLAANMIGSDQERQFGKAVLDHLKLKLLAVSAS